ncbi:MAG: flavohemoprotein [Chloroflexi bacterium]|nr:flavohemoprotein [Chloroflexota bacterium]
MSDLLQMDATKLKALEQSFYLVEERGEEFTAAFYGRFFNIYPEVRVTFSNTNLPDQHRKLLKALKTIVGSLRNPDVLEPYLGQLGNQHKDAYVVADTDFQMFKRALMDTFEEFLGDDFSDEAREAWSEAYDKISGVMKGSVESGQ